MIYLPIEKLTEGMELARNIPGINPMLPFAVTGCKLSERMINRMKRIGIQGVYISTALTEGIEPEDFVEPELKAKFEKIYLSVQQTGLRGDRQSGRIRCYECPE